MGGLPKDPPGALAADPSWIRLYVLLRTASQRISAADIVADLDRRGFKCERAFVSEILRALERKGYLARIAAAGPRPDALYVLTERGRGATSGLGIKIRELFADLTAGTGAPATPRAGN